MNSKQRIFFGFTFMSTLVGATLLFTHDAKSDDTYVGKGTAAVYGHVSPDQIEFLSTPESIMSAVSSGAPSKIWETLEHGEKVECLDCIAAVAPLLYDANPEVREISAWWLRRRMFGVFGEGEVYQKTVSVLKSDSNATKRANAAYALGEFLAQPGIAAVSDAIRTDSDPHVRAAAASALGRLNDDGAGALSVALGDSAKEVKLAALKSVGRINSFTDATKVAGLLGDGDALVRKRAIETLETIGGKDAATALQNLATTDADADVRAAACHALGTFRDGASRTALDAISKNDANGFVRDQAAIALRRL